MKNKHFNLTSGIVLILIPLVFSFTGCKDDYETYYEGYGLVSKSGDEKFTVKLDDGYLLYPREYYFNPEKLNDSTRLRIRFNILEEQDTNLYARIVYADTILTKSILPYDETILVTPSFDLVSTERKPGCPWPRLQTLLLEFPKYPCSTPLPNRFF